MKKLTILLIYIISVLPAWCSESFKMKDVFASMPDSLLPLVTETNRLDCVDFIENDMEAKVRNRADEYVELKKLTADYLLFQTSEISTVEMKLLQLSDTSQIICMVRTCLVPLADSHVQFYNCDWSPVAEEDLAKLNGCRPSLDEFFLASSSAEKDELIKSAKLILSELPLMEAHLSADSDKIVWTIGLSELPKDEKKAVQNLVQPVSQSILR